MTRKQELGQLLLLGVYGLDMTPESAALLRKFNPGGVIIFGRNLEDPQSGEKSNPKRLRKFIDDIKENCTTEPIVTIDQEGGRVSRLRLIGNEPPSAYQLCQKGDPKFICQHGKLTGRLMRLYGFNLNLCPTLDVSLDENADNSLRGRCYGRNIEEVIVNAGLFNSHMRKQGILSCGKHFPGYTRANCDAHEDFPIIDLSASELEAFELAPYFQMADELDSIMICHARYPSLSEAQGDNLPASFSKKIITELLRERMNYKGLIMSDDLDMGAITYNFSAPEAAARTIIAGSNLAMQCHRPQLAGEIVEEFAKLPDEILHDRLQFLAKFKKRLPKAQSFSAKKVAAIDDDIWRLRVDVLGKELAAISSIEDAKRSPVEDF